MAESPRREAPPVASALPNGAAPAWRRTRAALGLTVLIAAAVAVERVRWFPALLGAAAIERAWIWTSDPPRRVEPRAFFAVRDFELGAPPAAAVLELLGDPEYVAFLNGARVGSGRAGGEPRIDRYEVAPLLRAGENRLVLELRSPSGGGVATARLVDGAERVLAAADADWLVYRSAWRGLLAGDPLYPTGRVAVVATTPFARWAAAAPGPLLPLFEAAVAGEAVAPEAVRTPPDAAWRRPGPPPRRRRLGGRVEADFGREVTGYLQLSFDRRAPARGLLRFASEAGFAADGEPDAIVLSPANRGSWQDALPRRFRYVEVVGIEELSRIALFPVGAAAFARLAPPPPPAPLLGARQFPVRLPLVEQIWRAHGAPSGAPAAAAAPAAVELRPGDAGRTAAPTRARAARRRREPS
jgi:hypothetical protein